MDEAVATIDGIVMSTNSKGKAKAPTLEDRVTKLEHDFEKSGSKIMRIDQSRAGHASRLLMLERSLQAARDRLDAITPQLIEAQLAELNPRVESVARRFQALIVRDCVFTEVMHATRYGQREFVLRGLLAVWDRNDDWWLERDGPRWTIKAWQKFLAVVSTSEKLSLIHI